MDDQLTKRPTIVVLCGSSRFWREYQEANRAETLSGRIVLTIAFHVHPPATGTSQGLMETVSDFTKAKLDELHLRKIDLADEVFIINPGGYVGQSTRAELDYARRHNKIIRSLEPLEERA